MALAAVGCSSDYDLPPVQIESDLFSYAADEAICAGTVESGERWMKGFAARLGIDESELQHTTYYRLSLQDTLDRCGGQGCTRTADGAVSIFDSAVLDKYGLVNSIRLSGWPSRRPVLHMGLAGVFDDANVGPLDWRGGLDVDAQLEANEADADTYFVGVAIVYWTIQRHGMDAFREFWFADVPDSSAEEFRALYQQHFGESLDAMLAEVEGQTAYTLVTCVEDVVEWQGSSWTTSSPTSCDDGLVRGNEDELWRSVLVEIPTTGHYVITVSDSPISNQGAYIHSCGTVSTAVASFLHFQGDSSEVLLDAGLHRVTTGKFGADDPGIDVEIHPK